MCKPSNLPKIAEYIDNSYDETINEIESNIVTGELDKEKLKYEVALYKEEDDNSNDVGQVVTIGTLLQLRVAVTSDNDQWRHVSLQKLILSPSRTDPEAPGHVVLVSGGCRVAQYGEIVPRDPWTEVGEREVRINFEAVMLDVTRSQESRMWIHVNTRACKYKRQCQAQCINEEQFRYVRSVNSNSKVGIGSLLTARRLEVLDDVVVRSDGLDVNNDDDNYEDYLEDSTDFSENIVLSVIRPGDGYYLPAPASNSNQNNINLSSETTKLISDCSTFLIFGIMMGCLLIVASIMMCLLAYRLNTMASTYKVISVPSLTFIHL